MPSGTSPGDRACPRTRRCPRWRGVKPGDELEQRRLAAARRADHGEELALAQRRGRSGRAHAAAPAAAPGREGLADAAQARPAATGRHRRAGYRSRLQVVGQEARVDDLAVVDVARDRADRASAPRSCASGRPCGSRLRPSRARPCVLLVVRLRTALRATSSVDVVCLGDDVARPRPDARIMNFTALRRARITARMKSPFFSAISTVVTPTTLSSGGSASLATTTARYLSLNFDHSGSVIGATSIWPESSAATPSPKPPVFTSSASSGL